MRPTAFWIGAWELLFVAAPALLANYPNPFNPETWIPLDLAETSRVRISRDSGFPLTRE